MIDVIWFNGARGFWDHQMLMECFNNSLYQSSGQYQFKEHINKGYKFLVPGVEGAVVVIPARCHVPEIDSIKEQLDKLKWCVFVCAGDEEAVFPWQALKGENRSIWIQCPMPGIHDDANYYIPTGARPDTRNAYCHLHKGLEPPAFNRSLSWMFAGQRQNATRAACIDALRGIPDGWLNVTEGFGKGVEYNEYIGKMMDSFIVPS